MKAIKKVCALVLALCMCLSLGTTAFAASSTDTDFSITISNSNNGSTYNAYKIFDVTYDDAGHYSYTLTDTATTEEGVTTHSNPWYALLTDSGSPFTLTASTGVAEGAEEGAIIYVVTVNENVTDEAIIAYLNAAIATIASYDADSKTWTVNSSYTVAGTANGNGGTVTITLSEPGYYFVTTTTGSIVSITTTDPTATIIDKQTPPPDIEKVIAHDDGTTDSAEADGMGEEVNFDVTATVPITETIDDNGTQTYNYVTDYTITDSMTNGLLIELEDSQFTYDETTGKYYLTDDMINEWITLTNGAGNSTLKFTEYVYDYSFELLGYDTYTDSISGGDVHTFSGFVLTYYTYNVDLYKTNLYNALAAAYPENINSIWPDGYDWPISSLVPADFDFDSESYFEEYNAETNLVGTKYPANASIEIKYSAHVTSLEGYENTNEIYLDHHVTPFSHPTPWSPTPGPQKFALDYVYSWELQILKVDGEDKVMPLEGATFTLYSANMKDVKVGHSYLYVPISLFDNGVYTDDEGNTYNFVDFESTHYVKSGDSYVVGEGNDENDTYVRILTGSAEVDNTEQSHSVTATTNANGEIDFDGLGTGVYILTEITAPDGYNLLEDPIIFKISFEETGDDATGYVGRFTVTYGSLDENGGFEADQSDYGTNLYDNYILVQTIENNSGAILPGTGGMGTTIFYVIGAILVCGAAVLLITRRRMSRAA